MTEAGRTSTGLYCQWSKTMTSKEVKDFFAGLLAIVFSIVYFFNTLNIKSMGFSQISASFFPRIIAILLLLLGLILVIKNLKNTITWFKEINFYSTKNLTLDKSFFFRHKVVFTMLFFALYCILIDILGFLSASILYLFFQILLFSNAFTKKTILTSSLIAVMASVVVYVTFQFGFSISLPNGLLV